MSTEIFAKEKPILIFCTDTLQKRYLDSKFAILNFSGNNLTELYLGLCVCNFNVRHLICNSP